MALEVGSVAVEFAANLDQLFKQLEKLAEKIDEAFAGDQTIKVEFDDRVAQQIDKIADGVQKISDLTERFRGITEGIFDSLDGRIGNTSEQIEKSFGGAIKGIDNQTDDFITKFINKVGKGVARLNPLVLGQLFGATLLIERLVAGSFKLTSILPRFITQGQGIGKVLTGLITAIKTLDVGFLLKFVVDISQSLLSVTTVVALLTTGLRALTGLALRFFGRRPETQVQKFVVLLETLNAGLTEMLARTRIFIERMFFITSSLTAMAGVVTLLVTGVKGLAGVVSPFLAFAFVGISAIRLAVAKVSDWLLRIRASAGDGRAQTTLFLRSLRSLFPILDAIAENAKPIARMIREFAKGGVDKRVKEVTKQFQEVVKGIKQIDQSLRKLTSLMKSTGDKMLKQMDEIISKADLLFKQIGRQGARDAIASIERVRTSATEAVADVKSSVASIAPTARQAGESVKRLGARFFEMTRSTLRLVGMTGVSGAGSLLSLLLFGASQNVAAFLSPLSAFRERLLTGFASVATAAKETGKTILAALGPDAATEGAAGGIVTTAIKDEVASPGFLTIALELSKKFWSTFVDPAVITNAMSFAGSTISALSPLLAVGFGAVFAPLVLRGVKNLTTASFSVVKDAASSLWPEIQARLVEPVKDFLLFVPRQVNKFVRQTVPDAVKNLTARVFKGTVAIQDRVKQFFGIAELTEAQANEKAIQAINERTAGIRKQQAAMKERLALLKESAMFGGSKDGVLERREKLRQVEEKLHNTRIKAVRLEKQLAGGTAADPREARQELERQRKEIEKLTAAADTLSRPFSVIQDEIERTEGELRGLTNRLSKELSRESIEGLAQEIQRNSRPVRATIARVGIDAATSFASGIKAAKSVVAAVLVAPFSAAATKRQVGTAATNLAKSFRAAFSAAFRVAGGIANLLGLKGLGARLTGRAGTTSGLTAGTPEEEAAKRKADAQLKAAKVQEELIEVMRAEKIVSEAGIKRQQLEQQTADLQIENQKLMSGEMEKTENVLREMTTEFEGLVKTISTFEERARNTTARVGGLSEVLDPSEFRAGLDLAREIQANVPSFKALREQFDRLADITGMDAQTRQNRLAALDRVEAKLRDAMDERVNAMFKLTGSTEKEISLLREQLAAAEAAVAADQQRADILEAEIATAKRLKAPREEIAKREQELATLRTSEIPLAKLRVEIADKASKAEGKLIAEVVELRESIKQQKQKTQALAKEQDLTADRLEQANKDVQGAAAFIKFSKQMNTLAGQVKRTENEFQRLQEVALETGEQLDIDKAAAAQQRLHDAQARLARAEENRANVVSRATDADAEALLKLRLAFEQQQKAMFDAEAEEKKFTKRLEEVSGVLLANRNSLTSLPNAAKDFARTFNTITKTAGTEQLATLAAQAASGEDLVVFTDKATAALREQVASIEAQKDTLDAEEKAARKLLESKKNSTQLQKQLDRALRDSTITEQQLAAISEKSEAALKEVSIAEDEVASAATQQEKAVRDSTSATTEMSAQAREVARALERAKLSIDEGGQAMKELAVSADETKAEAEGGAPRRLGARTGQAQVGQLRDLLALLVSGASPKTIEKDPLGPVREKMKNAPELLALEGLGDQVEPLQAVLAILNKITQKPVERVKKLSDNFNNLTTLLRRLESNPERLQAFFEQFDPKAIADLAVIVGLLDKFVAVINKIQVRGSEKGRAGVPKLEVTALRTIAQLVEQNLAGAIDFDEIPQKLLEALRETFSGVKGIEFGGQGTQAIAAGLEVAVRRAMGQVAKGLSARAEKGLGVLADVAAQQIKQGQPKMEKAGADLVKPIADNLPGSLPKRGPLRDALVRLPILGEMMGQQMLKGVGALQSLLGQFMSQGFEGFLPAAFEAASSVATTFIGGLGTGLNKIGDAVRSIPLVGILGEIPLKVAGTVTKALGVVAAGIAKMGAKISSSVTNLVKETSTKLLKLGLDATRLRLDPNNLQRFNEAMGILGGSASDAEAGLQQLIQSIEQVARGSAPELERAFAEAGLSLEDLRKMDSDDIFLRVAQAANQASGDIRKQSDLLRLIGADFSSLRGVILQGGDAIADAFERANKNPPISQKTLELGSKFTGVMSQIEQTIERIKLIVFEELAPILNDALETFGRDSRTQIDFILENVRTAVRIVINTIQLVADFINNRYIQASDGADQFFTDLTVAGRIAFQSLGAILEVVVDKGGEIILATVAAIWASLKGQTKSALGALLIDIIAAFASLANLILSPFQTAFDFVMKIGERAIVGLKLAFFEALDAVKDGLQAFADNTLNPLIDTLNEVLGVFDDDATIERVELGRGLTRQIRETRNELGKLKNEDLPDFFEAVKDNFDKTQKEIDLVGSSLKDALDIQIATGEMDAFLDGLKGADDEAERLRTVIEKLNKDGILKQELTGEETISRLRTILEEAASKGLVPPGAVSEGAERLKREAIKALGDVADETGEALKKAFEVGFDKLQDEFPAFAALLEEIGIQGQKELDATAARLTELRKSQEKLNERTKENLKVREKENLALIEQRRLLEAMRRGFDLRREILTMTDSFVGPFEEARRNVEQLELQLKEKTLELREFFEESSRTLDVDEQLEQTRTIAQQLGISTSVASAALEEMDAAATALRESMNALAAATPDERAIAEARVADARRRLAEAQKAAQQQLSGLQDDIVNDVADGFEQGIRVAASKPIVNILRENLIVPVLDAFKETIKGLVDGTLIEAAREAETIAQETGQKFSRVLFIISEFGQKIFERAFDNLLETTFNNLTEGLTASIQDAFKDAEGSATGLGDAAGAAIAAAIQAAIALAGLILSRLQGEISATEEAVESIVDSTEAIRGVISGQTTVAIKEAEDAFRDAQRPIVVRLDTIISLMRSAISGANIPSIPLAGAASSSIP